MSGRYITERMGNIVIQTLLNSDNEAVDLWAKDFHLVMESTPQEMPICMIVDVGQPGVVFTDYARQVSATLFTQYKARFGKLAFLFEWKTGPHIARLFVASLGKMTLMIEFFHSKDEALAWLQSAEND